MKKAVLILGGAMALGLAGCIEQQSNLSGDELAYRHHSVGLSQAGADTNTISLKKILALPETSEFQKAIIQKLAKVPREIWKTSIPPGSPDQAAVFEQLLTDLVAAESITEIRGTANRGTLLVAVHLEDAQAGQWNSKLSQVASSWGLGQPKQFTLEGATGWEAKNPEAALQFFRAGKWVVVAAGTGTIPGLNTSLRDIAKNGRPAAKPADALLHLDLDVQRLKTWLPGLSDYRLPAIQMTVRGRGESLRTEAKFRFARTLPITLEPWKIPTNAIHDPLNTFTAARGIAPLLQVAKGFAELDLKPVPNQYCLWGQTHRLAQTFGSIPIPNASDYLRSLAFTIPKLETLYLERKAGDFLFVSNRAELHYKTVPFIAPHLRPYRENGQDYLLGTLFGIGAKTNPAPRELFAQLEGKPDLLYYDWEVTQDRLGHARQLYSVQDVLNRRTSASTNTPSYRWSVAAAPLLGNTVTEVSRSSPKELSLVRRSAIGFTGFELAKLARWFESRGFPLTFEPPPALPGTIVPGQSGTK